jgi:hypothetical protein
MRQHTVRCACVSGGVSYTSVYLGIGCVLHNKPKAEVYPGHMLTGPKEEEEYTV